MTMKEPPPTDTPTSEAELNTRNSDNESQKGTLQSDTTTGECMDNECSHELDVTEMGLDEIVDDAEVGELVERIAKDPEKATKVVEGLELVLHQQTSFSGPLPPPELMEGYNRIDPSFAERLMAMTEAQHASQIRLTNEKIEFNSRMLTSDVKSESRGQIIACLVVLSAFATAAYCASLGLENAAIAIGSTTVVGLAVSFIAGRKNSSDTK